MCIRDRHSVFKGVLVLSSVFKGGEIQAQDNISGSPLRARLARNLSAVRIAAADDANATKVAGGRAALQTAVDDWTPQAWTGPARTRNGRRRVAFEMRFDPSKLAEYKRRHERIWPAMQEALVRNGWHAYSLFCGKDGRAFGVFESDGSFEECCERMAREEVNQRWQREMAPFSATKEHPDAAAVELDRLSRELSLPGVALGAPPSPARPAVAGDEGARGDGAELAQLDAVSRRIRAERDEARAELAAARARAAAARARARRPSPSRPRRSSARIARQSPCWLASRSGAARPANAGAPAYSSDSDDDDDDDDDAVVLVGIGCATVVALCLVAGGAYVAARRRSPREPAAAHPTKDAASPTVDMHDIRWATPRASGPVAGGAPNPMAVA